MKFELEIVRFDAQEIITASGCTSPVPARECATCYGSAGVVAHV